MNRGFLQSAAQMQQPLATPDAPSWWHPTPAPPPPQYNTCPFGGAPADTNYYPYHHRAPEVPPHESLSLLLMGGWPSAEDGGATGKGVASQVFHDQAETPVKQEGGGYAYGDGFDYANNMLDFSNSFRSGAHHLPPPPPPPRHHRSSSSSSECDGNKRARVQPPPSSPLKVRKEKLGDRITTLHQLVSPFGKTDTASVLMEAIQYIRFLQRQIEALSLPYLGTANSRRPHPSVGTEMTGMFPEDPGQLLNDHCNKRKKEGGEEEPERDLSGRGLCLVPVACTVQVGSDNGADYWAPAALAGGWPSDR